MLGLGGGTLEIVRVHGVFRDARQGREGSLAAFGGRTS
ncbi:Hypothetical protein CAP_5248 [Chondromyces apiculatus DSM 436]|uniref:Uncharacterized protein n=1 Tax=Chondromyces apiculatus DSM 436 TaxID=1192034 RepID=A0A017T3J1_9BACT|nr:Hypothetical protein CAP_5248 [Chondromyces apiculatus DSM 436]